VFVSQKSRKKYVSVIVLFDTAAQVSRINRAAKASGYSRSRFMARLAELAAARILENNLSFDSFLVQAMDGGHPSSQEPRHEPI
jgi:uncharacterized protein (DUF1778 family)